MSRGDYRAIINNKVYTDSLKEWNIELQQIDMIWYDLVVNEHDIFPLKELIIKKFKDLNIRVKDHLEKRFIYFIASRKKIRFSVKRTPEHSMFNNKLYVYVEVGKEKVIKRIELNIGNLESEIPITPNVEVSSKFITFTDLKGDKHTSSIHDFLLHIGCNLGIDTEVQYVDKTKIPEKRPLNGSHTGLNEILYKLSNEENDIFIYYNLFKIMVSAENVEKNINFITPNSMTDEIKVEKEGDILEKCLILHFSSKNQIKNKDKETAELTNNLITIAMENKIRKVSVRYEVDDTSEYYCFGSSSIKPKHNHSFCFFINNSNQLTKSNIENIYT